ncbi:hypothetical protein PV325_013091 [Microctonus aethiopoides]|nr:hypothetical protein PV325_013091 [Microctonus aethiopoides]
MMELEKNEEDSNNNNLESKQARLGKKRIQRNLRKCFRDNKKLINHNETLRKKINSLNKKLQRLKMKKSDPTSPEYKVDKLLKHKNVDSQVRKTLLFHEVMVQQLRSSYRDTKSLKFKQILGRAISGKIVKKYRQQSAVKKNIAPIISSRVHRSNNPLEYVKNKKKNQVFIQDQVKLFYDENSKIIPDKKACIKINGKQITKRYMNATIKDLHAQFCSQSTYRVSYCTFAKLRPRY